MQKDSALQVFELDNSGKFDAIGEINQYTKLVWPNKFNGYSTFELSAPITKENKELLKEGRIVWNGGDNAAIIQIIQADKKSSGVKTYLIKGRTLEATFKDRIIFGTYSCSNLPASTAMYEIVTQNCVNPSNAVRKIPFLECAPDTRVGKSVSYQKTGGEVYQAIETLATGADLGFEILFRPREKKLIFKVVEGVDRSLVSSTAPTPPVVLSTDLEDILEDSYYKNTQDKKTVAYVMGEGEGADRKRIMAGDDLASGFNRRELYVDARDLQSGTESPEKYDSILLTRGNEKLSQYQEIETFEATIRVIGGQYTYGVDYNKGDKVVIQDLELGVQLIARVTAAKETFGSAYSLELTFGYQYLSLPQKLRRGLSQ